MKTRLFIGSLVLVICSNILFAQNYNIVSLGNDYFFDKNTEIYAVSPDSMFVLPNGDICYRHFSMYREVPFNTNTCIDVYGGSFYGKTNLYSNDSIFMFFTVSDDTVILKPLAQANEEWTFFQWQNQDLFIEATITNIGYQDVFGNMDEVKTITLLVKNSLNQNFVNHPFNQKVLYLSKSFGLLNTFDFYHFPEDNNLYLLKKVQASNERGQINIKSIFDFSIGDEFHIKNVDIYDGFIAPGVSQIHHGQKRNGIIKVISKQTYNPDTAVSYQFERCEMIFNYFQGNIDTTYSNDTITETYIYKSFNDPVLKQLPWQTFFTQSYVYNDKILRQFHNIQQNSRMTFQYYDRIDMSMMDSCWRFVNADPSSGYTNYLEGCGGPYYYRELWGAYVNVLENKLIYYKKGNETWGTPFAPSCLSLINDIDQHIVVEPKIDVYPIPSSSSIFVTLSDFKEKEAIIEFISMQGLSIFRKKIITNNNYEFPVDDFKNGVYIIKVTSNNASIVTKIIIKK